MPSAWSMIGHDGPQSVRIVGGRALYDAVMFTDGGRQQQVLLARLEGRSDGLHQVNRYVHPDTELELVPDAAA